MERRVFAHLKEHSKVPPEENTVQKQHNTESLVQEGLGYWIFGVFALLPRETGRERTFSLGQDSQLQVHHGGGQGKMPQLPGWG